MVRQNLRYAFPEKSLTDILKIEQAFYKHMCDSFLEMIKSLGMSEQEMKNHMVFNNPEIFEPFEKAHKSVILVCGHYASYEWMMSLGYHIHHKGYAVYAPLGNKYFDRLVQKIRSRHQAFLIPRKQATATIKQHKEEGVLGMYGLASNQTPSAKYAKYWRPFLGVRVPVFTGAETLAKTLDMPVVFFDVQKVKRGYYQTTFTLITDAPKTYNDFEITDVFTELLENQIRNRPEYYLWTHNRFKHKDKNPSPTAVIK